MTWHYDMLRKFYPKLFISSDLKKFAFKKTQKQTKKPTSEHQNVLCVTM